ncbi:MAG: site-specific tyrosine recombinase XerC [Acidobacteria bacterium]|nr:site-specific tyrosine recombinase XerC [Acidobacteriota bacterium]
MARVVKKRKPAEPPASPLAAVMEKHLDALRVQNYSEYTVKNRRVHIGFFVAWCHERGLSEPLDVTRPVLERYQRHLFHYRQKNGQPLSFRSQHSRLVPIRVWFRWIARQRLILHNPASELELPRLGHRLPKHVLTTSEAECVLAQPDVNDPLGLRDRALLETLYSTGMRRLELANLKLYDLDTERGTLMIRQGKGKKDRVIPIGDRAAAWVEKYVQDGRTHLVVEPDDGTVFLSNAGEPFSLDHLSDLVRVHVDAAQIAKRGACHLFRHTMATLMLENGADIRYIQAMLGHADLKTTQIYTQVSIRHLKQIHSATHPAQLPKKDGDAKPNEAAREELRNALAAEQDEDEEQEP